MGDEYETEDARTRAYVPPSPGSPPSPHAPSPPSGPSRALVYVVAIGAALLVVVAVFAIGLALGSRSTAPAAPAPTAAVPAPESAAAAVTPGAVAPAAAPLSPIEQIAVRTMADTARLEQLPEAERNADLEARFAIGGPRYAALERNANAHVGEAAAFRGRVEQIQDTDTGGSVMRVSTGSYGQRVVWVETLGPAPDWVERGKRVRVVGYLTGPYSYASQAGWQITIPAMVAVGVMH